MNGIIVPKAKSKPVTSFKEIEQEALRTAAVLRGYESPSRIQKRSIALHHSQISQDPYDFFVVDPKATGDKYNGFFLVMNPKILSSEDRQKVYEGCLSFPFRQDVAVNRYMKLKVSYDSPGKNGELEHKEEVVAGLLAQVFQYEAQHARGEHIYL